MYEGAGTRCGSWYSKNLILWNLPSLMDFPRGLEIFSFSVLSIVGSVIKLCSGAYIMFALTISQNVKGIIESMVKNKQHSLLRSIV